MPNRCVVPGCRTGDRNSTVKRSVFKVPTDKIILKKWESPIPNIAKLKPQHHVCERHFEEKYIIRKFVKYDEHGKLIAEVSIWIIIWWIFRKLYTESNLYFNRDFSISKY